MTSLPDPEYDAAFYADVPLKRGLAFVVDTVVIVAIALLIVPFTAFTALFFLPFLVAVVGFIYRTATLTTRSATWGMRLMAIEFRDARGRPFDVTLAALHTLGTTLSFGTILVQVVSIVLMLTSARGQGLTDHVLGTVAINRPGRS